MFVSAGAILGFGVVSYLYRKNLAALVISAIGLIAALGADAIYMKRQLSQLTKPVSEARRGR